MSKGLMQAVFVGLVMGLVMIVAPSSSARQSAMSQLADGVLVYLGVMPTATMLEHKADYPGHFPNERVPTGKNVHHVMLALFDNLSGERITDADVDARISPLRLVGPKKHFHTMTEAGAPTYCAYFTLSPRDRYVIHVTVSRPQMTELVEAEFECPLHE